MVDVARALGVSHAAVYRHVATKAELRDLVVGRWAETTMPPLRAIAAKPGPASKRLRQLFDALIAVKRRRAAEEPELFAAYRTLAADAQSVVAAHLDEWSGWPQRSSDRAWRKARSAPSTPWPPAGRCCSPRPDFTTRSTLPSGPTRPSTRHTTTCGGC